MSDQDKQAIVGNYRIIANMSMGKLFVTSGLNNTFLAQVQFNGAQI